MGLLKNRLRTIIGEDAGFMQALSSLFVYSTNPQRIGKIGKKIKARLFSRKPTYPGLLAQQTIGDPAFPDQVSFYIVSSQPVQQKYRKYKVIEAENIGEVPADAYVLFMDEGDILDEAALQELNKTIVQQQFPQLVSFDFDYHKHGTRTKPQFNPAWSPQRLRNHNYLKNAVCIHKALIPQPMQAENAAAACYAILSPVAERKIASAYIGKVMLSKLYTPDLEEEEEVITGITLSGQPLVSIIIPTFNKAHLVKQCITSIINISEYTNYEIILVDNRSSEQELFVLIDGWKAGLKERFTHLKADYPFNFSRLMNDGAAKAKGEYLLLLNNDTEVISPDWMEQLLAIASGPMAGCVGARLMYPNDTVQHAGIALNPETISRHLYLGMAVQDEGYRNAINTVQNYLAVTAACMMIDAEKYRSISGFDEKYEVEYNDIDCCLRMYEKGYYNAYTPYAALYHYESASRQHPLARRDSYQRHQRESAQMRQQWAKYIGNDPFVNRNAVTLQLI